MMLMLVFIIVIVVMVMAALSPVMAELGKAGDADE